MCACRVSNSRKVHLQMHCVDGRLIHINMKYTSVCPKHALTPALAYACVRVCSHARSPKHNDDGEHDDVGAFLRLGWLSGGRHLIELKVTQRQFQCATTACQDPRLACPRANLNIVRHARTHSMRLQGLSRNYCNNC